MSQVNGVDMGLDEDTFSEILWVPTIVIKTIRLGERSIRFLGVYSDLEDLNNKSINKKVLKGRYELLFELLHRALLLRSERRGIVTGPNLCLMEILSIYIRS